MSNLASSATHWPMLLCFQELARAAPLVATVKSQAASAGYHIEVEPSVLTDKAGLSSGVAVASKWCQCLKVLVQANFIVAVLGI